MQPRYIRIKAFERLIYPLYARSDNLFGLPDLHDDPAVEDGQEDEWHEGRQRRPDPVDVVELVVGVQANLSRLDVRRIVGSETRIV